jgi:hypothetical protein
MDSAFKHLDGYAYVRPRIGVNPKNLLLPFQTPHSRSLGYAEASLGMALLLRRDELAILLRRRAGSTADTSHRLG